MKVRNKLLLWCTITCILFTSGCALFEFVPGQIASVDSDPVQSIDQPKGMICFTGYQITHYNPIYNADVLMEHFLEILDAKIREHLVIHHYTQEEVDEYEKKLRTNDRISLGNHGLLGESKFVDTVKDQIFVPDNSNKYSLFQEIRRRIMSKTCLEYLNSKVGADYYLSLTQIGAGYLPNNSFRITLILSQYDKIGQKIFCKTYSKDYGDSQEHDKLKSAKNRMQYLEKMLSDCAPEINADLSFIEKM